MADQDQHNAVTRENAMAKRIAENVQMRAAHQIMTIVGFPLLLGLCGWTLKTMAEANERLAVLETLRPRIERLENMADLRGSPYPMADGRQVERDMRAVEGGMVVLEGRVAALERIVRP